MIVLLEIRIDSTNKEIEDFFSFLSGEITKGIDRTYEYTPVYRGETELDYRISKYSPIGSATIKD